MAPHSDAQPTPDRPVPFGRYELLELVGEGAMAQVFRARQSGPMGFTKEVAIKRLRRNAVRRDRQELEALVNEARLGGQLRHPHVVEVYGCDVADGTFFMAMEFVKGWTLDDVLNDFGEAALSIPLAAVVDVLRQLARGLTYAHSARDEGGQPMGLVHRDLKPQNIFLDERGLVKIADFGLAKSTANLYQTASAEVTKGSPLYMSPEQIHGEALDARSDLFAVGSIAVELVTGLRAFEGNSVANTLKKVLDVDCAEAWEPFEEQAPLLAPVVARLLSLKRDDRYPDAAALARDLDALAPGDAIGLQTAALAGAMGGARPEGLSQALWTPWESILDQLPLDDPQPPPRIAPRPAAPNREPVPAPRLREPVPAPRGREPVPAPRPPATAPRPAATTPRPAPLPAAPPHRQPAPPPVPAPPLEHEDSEELDSVGASGVIDSVAALLVERQTIWALVVIGLVLVGAIGWMSLRILAPDEPVAVVEAPAEAPRPEVPAPFAHERAASARPWQDLSVRVTAADGVERDLRCLYRAGSGWRAVPMPAVGRGAWEAVVPVTGDFGATLEYYIEARSEAGLVTLASRALPFRVPVE